jgi:hypothetical protein
MEIPAAQNPACRGEAQGPDLEFTVVEVNQRFEWEGSQGSFQLAVRVRRRGKYNRMPGRMEDAVVSYAGRTWWRGLRPHHPEAVHAFAESSVTRQGDHGLSGETQTPGGEEARGRIETEIGQMRRRIKEEERGLAGKMVW